MIQSQDRRCPAWSLDNRVRRWLSPPRLDVDLLEPIPGDRVVDLGAGVGYLTPSLLDRLGSAGELILVEPNPKAGAVLRARWEVDGRVRIFQASAGDVPMIPGESQDRAVLSLVLCCMVDKRGALDEAWRILRPGGLALVSYPEPGWRLRTVQRSLQLSRRLWDGLVVAHPWKVRRSFRRLLVRRHLLEKPAVASPLGARSG